MVNFPPNREVFVLCVSEAFRETLLPVDMCKQVWHYLKQFDSFAVSIHVTDGQHSTCGINRLVRLSYTCCHGNLLSWMWTAVCAHRWHGVAGCQTPSKQLPGSCHPGNHGWLCNIHTCTAQHHCKPTKKTTTVFESIFLTYKGKQRFRKRCHMSVWVFVCAHYIHS